MFGGAVPQLTENSMYVQRMGKGRQPARVPLNRKIALGDDGCPSHPLSRQLVPDLAERFFAEETEPPYGDAFQSVPLCKSDFCAN